MTPIERIERTRLPLYDWRTVDVGRSLRLLPDGQYLTARSDGFWRCSCTASGHSQDAGTAAVTADQHAEAKHGS